MAKMTEIKLADYSPEVLKQMEKQVMLGLELIGQQAEGYAKGECPVDTGLLRNSITHALPGKKPKIKSYKADKSDSSGRVNSGAYSSAMPKNGDEHAVYIGSNVEYAVDVEFNATKRHNTGKAHFLKDAATLHTGQYKEIMKLALKGKNSI